jgi:hypothetical protein
MNSETPLADGQQKRRRPDDVTSLLHGWERHDAWNYANRRASRFYVINVPLVLGRLRLMTTKAGAYFDAAEKVIAEQTTWHNDQPFDYTCSHTQIYPQNIREPKTFGRAVTIIVAMEMAAADTQPELDVYHYLRILPAHHFVDGFDQKRLQELEAAHNGMRVEEKVEKFGPLAQKSFEDVCLASIEQSKAGLVTSLTEGYCVTKYTAEKLMTFVNSNYPELKVGPVLSSGQHSISEGLGEKNAAEGLRVPGTIDVKLLLPCR